MEISFSPSFRRIFKKKIKGRKEIEEKYWENVKVFINDPFSRPKTSESFFRAA